MNSKTQIKNTIRTKYITEISLLMIFWFSRNQENQFLIALISLKANKIMEKIVDSIANV